MFSRINILEKNDSIFIYDIYGNKLEYKIYKKYIAEGNDTDYLKDSSSIEITLITCSNLSNSKKLIIKAISK